MANCTPRLTMLLVSRSKELWKSWAADQPRSRRRYSKASDPLLREAPRFTFRELRAFEECPTIELWDRSSDARLALSRL